MAGITGLEIFEIERREVGWVFRRVDGVAEVVVELEVLRFCGGREQEEKGKQVRSH